MAEEKDFYTLQEMAKILGISVGTLKNRIYSAKGHPPYFCPAAGKYQFPIRDFVRWRDSRVVKASA